jgi:hypothetical protein
VVTKVVVRAMVVTLVVVVVVLVKLVVVTIVVGSGVLVVDISVVVEVVELAHIFHPALLTVLSLVQVMSPDGTTLLGPALPL